MWGQEEHKSVFPVRVPGASVITPVCESQTTRHITGILAFGFFCVCFWFLPIPDL